MNSVKILHCADIHIGAALSYLGETAAQRKYETLLTFERIIDTAVTEGVKIIAAAGDIFDSNTVEDSFVNAVFEKIASVPEIKVVLALGNHDPLSSQSPFKNRELPKNLFVLGAKDECITFDDLKTRVYGRSFDDVYLKGEEGFSITPEKDGYVNLMVLHGELRSDLNSNYNSVTANFIKESGMDYIALGHIHKRTEPQKIGDTYYAYCGCPEGQGFDELGEKGVYLGEVSKVDCNLQFIPTAKRMHLCESIDISGLLTSNKIATHIIDVIKQKYPDNFADNLYKFILTGYVDETADISIPQITSRINEVVYFAKIRNKSEIKVDFELLSQEKSLKGIFVKNMLEKINKADQPEKDRLKAALDLGLKAFSGEVQCDEN